MLASILMHYKDLSRCGEAEIALVTVRNALCELKFAGNPTVAHQTLVRWSGVLKARFDVDNLALPAVLRLQVGTSRSSLVYSN